MKKKTADDIASALDEIVSDNYIGSSELANLLETTIKAGGYTNPAEILAMKEQVRPIYLELRASRRRAS